MWSRRIVFATCNGWHLLAWQLSVLLLVLGRPQRRLACHVRKASFRTRQGECRKRVVIHLLNKRGMQGKHVGLPDRRVLPVMHTSSEKPFAIEKRLPPREAACSCGDE